MPQTVVTGEFLLHYSFVVDQPQITQDFKVTLVSDAGQSAIVGNATATVIAASQRLPTNNNAAF